MPNRKIARFQGQIETALKNFRADLELAYGGMGWHYIFGISPKPPNNFNKL